MTEFEEKASTAYALVRSRDLYAHAAAGPEKAYPACLQIISAPTTRLSQFAVIAYGAMMTLALDCGHLYYNSHFETVRVVAAVLVDGIVD